MHTAAAAATVRPHPVVPAVALAERAPRLCPPCGHPITAGQEVGTFRGAECHRVCALELHIDALEDRLAEVETIARNAAANVSFYCH